MCVRVWVRVMMQGQTPIIGGVHACVCVRARELLVGEGVVRRRKEVTVLVESLF